MYIYVHFKIHFYVYIIYVSPHSDLLQVMPLPDSSGDDLGMGPGRGRGRGGRGGRGRGRGGGSHTDTPKARVCTMCSDVCAPSSDDKCFARLLSVSVHRLLGIVTVVVVIGLGAVLCMVPC
jgi:hypothetical protein